MRSRAAVLVAALATLVSLTAPAVASVDDGSNGAPQLGAGRYVVIMEAAPLAGDFAQEDLGTASAVLQAEELLTQQAAVLEAVGVAADRVTLRYTTSLNGFAVELSEIEAAKMKSAAGVLMVLPDVMRFKQTDSSPDYLGLTRNDGAYDNGLNGSGVIVGVIDSGIWPEHPSFADDGNYPDPGVVLDDSERPSCDFGNTAQNPDDTEFQCNNKLIGARQMLTTYRSFIGADPDEYDSARDDDGHGTHTASTAAGNADVPAEIFGIDRGMISGIAPAAHIIAYKALGNLGGFTSDLAAAIDAAVADGVDVINYSVGGGAGAPAADDIAFLFAADAGVHVATSAGNAGPDPATVGSPGTLPWLTTVGASTQKRFFQGTVHLGNRTKLAGASITAGSEARLDVVDAEDAGGDLCSPGELDASMVDGKIVLCRRGGVGRAAKSLAVFQAGGAGMILYNNADDDNLFTDSHWVPTVHLDHSDGLIVKRYIDTTQGPNARLIGEEVSTWSPNPSMTIFSARGPTITPDVIKPDITAPGLQILAGYSPTPDPDSDAPGQLFGAIAGTSMSSPHVAGLFALLDQAHPDWSPAAAKSALMTTAHQNVKDNDRVTTAGPFARGAGHVAPGQPGRSGSAFQPGVVYQAGFNDYLGWLCGTFPEVFADDGSTCAALEGGGIPTDPSDLNYPSIAIADVVGVQTVTRTLTSVAETSGRRIYRAAVDAPLGFDVTVSPATVRLAQGESATFEVTVTNATSPLGEWQFGDITWTSGPYRALSPIAVRGAALSAPAAVRDSGVDGATSFPVSFGYTGEYSAAGHGLEPATVISDVVAQDPDQSFDPADGFSNVHDVTATGAALLRIVLPPEATGPETDIDIYVFDSSATQIASSTAGGTNEFVEVALPADDTYSVYVHGWSTPGGAAEYDLYTWVISATPGGNLNIDSAPSGAVVATTGTVGISWTGARAGEWHLGAISHTGPDGLLDLTVVEVDNR